MNKRTLLIVLVVAAVIKMVLAMGVPLTPDEGLHWMQGRHLAWGYTDHPPGTAVLNWLGGVVFGASILSVRFFPIVSTLMCSVMVFLILKETGHSEKSAVAGGLVIQVVPMVLLGIIMVPVVPFALLIMTAEYFFIRALNRRRLADHLLWGLFLGLSVVTYYIAAVAVLGVILFCLGGGRWKCLVDWRFWSGAILAGAIAAPNLWWNFIGGSESAVMFQFVKRSPYVFSLTQPISYALLCVLLGGPLILPAFVLAAKNLIGRRGKDTDQWKTLFAIMVVVPVSCFLLISFFRECGGHWVILSFLNAPLLLAQRRESFPAGLKKWSTANIVISSALALLALTVVTVGIERCAEIAGVQEKLAGSRKARHFFNAGEAGKAAHRLKEAFSQEGSRVSLATDKWASAGVLSFYTPGNPYYSVMPEPNRHGRDYREWNSMVIQTPIVLFASSRPALRKDAASAFSNVTRLEEAGGYYFYLCKP